MQTPSPIVLEDNLVRLEPLGLDHCDGLRGAASDGELWNLWFTSVPNHEGTQSYVESALAGLKAGHMLPWAVRDVSSGHVIGCTRFHDIALTLNRVEIGYTWYSKSYQRGPTNTACKLLLLKHAFDHLDCGVVGLRTDAFNFRSQRAIESLGAKKDGVIRRYGVRADGSIRDTVMYSILETEWPEVRRHLELRIQRLSSET